MRTFLLLLLVAVCSGALTCPAYSCISQASAANAQCGLVTASESLNCPSGYYCNNWNTTTGICGPLLPTGAVGCIMGENDNCNLNAMCVLGRSGQKYRSSLNTTVCQAYFYVGAIGQPCNEVTTCKGNLNCASGLCAVKPALGQACEDGVDCAGSSFCASNGICTALFTLPVSGICTDTIQCKTGEYCNIYADAVNGTCVAVGNPTNAACSDDTVCASYETCQCPLLATSSAAGICTLPRTYTANEAKSLSAIYDCTFANSCGGTVGTLNTALECTACQTQYCAYFNMTLGAEPTLLTTSLACLDEDGLDPIAVASYCNAQKVKSSSAILWASWAVLFAGLLVAV